MKKDLLTPLDLTPDQVRRLFSRAAVLKRARKPFQGLKGKTLALIFEKPSTRTKVSFDLAMYELGGHAVYLDSSQLGRGESYYDTGRVLSRYVDGIVIRTFAQRSVEELARGATVPVINGLSDLYHPCQVLTDIFTIQEVKKDFLKLNICYVGDGNNVANSWIAAALLLGFHLKVATPKGYEPTILSPPAKKIDIGRTDHVVMTANPVEAVRGADVVNTDSWFSMGQEVTEEKRGVFRPYQVNCELLRHAKRDAIVLHCLPAHRGEEITSDVMDGPQSKIWDQAENRLHVQKAILEMFLK